MSKKTLIILISVIVLLAVAFSAWYFTRKKNNPEANESNGTDRSRSVPPENIFIKDNTGKIQVSPLLKEAITKVKIAGIKIPGMKK